jgi:uncharacterized protein (DUF2235 family)
VKLAQAVKAEAADGTEQIVYYNAGVGTGDLNDQFLGGVLGRGRRNNVKRAYAFLSLNYEPGDEIYIFGFSRGAYTARALAGVIGASGIVKKEEYEKFEVAWNFYRVPPHVRKPVKDAEVKAVAAPADTSMSKKVEDVTKHSQLLLKWWSTSNLLLKTSCMSRPRYAVWGFGIRSAPMAYPQVLAWAR